MRKIDLDIPYPKLGVVGSSKFSFELLPVVCCLRFSVCLLTSDVFLSLRKLNVSA